MTSHLSEANIKNYLDNTISGDELLAVDDHLSQCDDCTDALSKAASTTRSSDPAVAVDLSTRHLDYGSFESIVNGTIDPVEKEIATVHLDRCESCSDELGDLMALRRELISPDVAEAAASENGISERIGAFFRSPYFVPALGLVLLGAIGLGWFALRSAPEPEQVLVPVVSETPFTNNDLTQVTPEGSANENSKADTPVVTSLNDGSRKIELDSNGTISGVSSQFEDRVRRALTKQELAIPANVRQLRGMPGVLMSGGSQSVPFAIVSPIGKAIETTNPRFTWKPLAGAESYRVEVYDEGFNLVAASPAVKSTVWQADVPLPRGKVYAWQATAFKNGEQVKSPVRPAPEAKFKVIDAVSAEGIAAAKRNGRSHLVLGVLYAEAGMLTEAEGEFAALLRANPNSDVVRNLLQKVRAAR